jgi:hypothetical protein
LWIGNLDPPRLNNFSAPESCRVCETGLCQDKNSVIEGAASFDDPFDIAAVGSGKTVVLSLLYRDLRALFDPFFYFRMSIRKTKTAGSTVVTGREIHPIIRICYPHDRPAIVDTVTLFIHKNPEHAGRWIGDIGHLLIAPPAVGRGVVPMGAFGRVVAGISTAFNKSIHTDTAHARNQLIPHFAIIDIARTLINAFGLRIRANLGLQ